MQDAICAASANGFLRLGDVPKVSVIVPNFNYARFLRKRIETILKQTMQDYELILLDDCSTDGSQTILSEYAGEPRVKMEFNEVNSGSPFKQWNKGVRMARGEYVWIAESDDYADERFLERLTALLDSQPEAAFAYCRSWRVREDDRVDGFGDWYLELVDSERWKNDFCVDGHIQFPSYFAQSCVVANASAVVFRKSFYERIGGADESFRICGDWKVWTSMSLLGKVTFVSEPLNYFRDHGASVVHQGIQSALCVFESARVVRWILDQVTLPQDILAKVYKAQAGAWVPALMSLRLPIRTKLEILRQIRLVDPHPFRRVAHPAMLTIQRKFLRHWRALRRVQEQATDGHQFYAAKKSRA
jgi:hypothetical protein